MSLPKFKFHAVKWEIRPAPSGWKLRRQPLHPPCPAAPRRLSSRWRGQTPQVVQKQNGPEKNLHGSERDTSPRCTARPSHSKSDVPRKAPEAGPIDVERRAASNEELSVFPVVIDQNGESKKHFLLTKCLHPVSCTVLGAQPSNFIKLDLGNVFERLQNTVRSRHHFVLICQRWIWIGLTIHLVRSASNWLI